MVSAYKILNGKGEERECFGDPDENEVLIRNRIRVRKCI
jgi:hypothetical protein